MFSRCSHRTSPVFFCSPSFIGFDSEKKVTPSRIFQNLAKDIKKHPRIPWMLTILFIFMSQIPNEPGTKTAWICCIIPKMYSLWIALSMISNLCFMGQNLKGHCDLWMGSKLKWSNYVEIPPNCYQSGTSAEKNMTGSKGHYPYTKWVI